jgi:hypothetical protein
LGLTFFGLTLDIVPEFRLNLFTQIHQIIFYGKGGYDWETIYSMPIWLRKFTFKQIKDFYDEEKKQMEEAKKGGSQTLVGTDGKVKSPEFLKNAKPKASYNTKASKN